MLEELDQESSVLAAVANRSQTNSDTTTMCVLAAGGGSSGKAIVAKLLRNGLLEGSFEENPTGEVTALFVRGITPKGQAEIFARISARISTAALTALGSVYHGKKVKEYLPDGDVTRMRDGDELLELEKEGLVVVGMSGHPQVTPLGRGVLGRPETQSDKIMHATFYGITNSQIAVGNSTVEGHIRISGARNDSEDFIDKIDELLRRIVALNDQSDQIQELRAELETMRVQYLSPRPKLQIISECLQNVRAIVRALSGDATYASLTELSRQL